MSPSLLTHYEAIEKASTDMLMAAQTGNWDEVIRIEGVCTSLICRLKNAIRNQTLRFEEVATKATIMRRILENDLKIRSLIEPYLQNQKQAMIRDTPTLH